MLKKTQSAQSHEEFADLLTQMSSRKQNAADDTAVRKLGEFWPKADGTQQDARASGIRTESLGSRESVKPLLTSSTARCPAQPPATSRVLGSVHNRNLTPREKQAERHERAEIMSLFSIFQVRTALDATPDACTTPHSLCRCGSAQESTARRPLGKRNLIAATSFEAVLRASYPRASGAWVQRMLQTVRSEQQALERRKWMQRARDLEPEVRRQTEQRTERRSNQHRFKVQTQPSPQPSRQARDVRLSCAPSDTRGATDHPAVWVHRQ